MNNVNLIQTGAIALYFPSEAEAETFGVAPLAGIVTAVNAPGYPENTAHLCLFPDKERLFELWIVKGRPYDSGSAPGAWSLPPSTP